MPKLVLLKLQTTNEMHPKKTPITDAAAEECRYLETWGDADIVTVKTSRNLEVKLNYANKEIAKMKADIAKVVELMQRPAANTRIMQIAQPAREAMNILRPHIKQNQPGQERNASPDPNCSK